jgi:Trypsin-co-occurring domain 2
MSEGTGTGASRDRGMGRRVPPQPVPGTGVPPQPVPGTPKSRFTDSPLPGVGLATAMEALWRTLKQAQQQGVRFETETVELTLGIELVQTGAGGTGREWRVRVDEHEPPGSGWVHTLTIRVAVPPA